MDILIAVIGLLALIPLSLMALTFMSTGEIVRGLIQDFFGIFVSIPQMLRNGCQQVLQRLVGFVRSACISTGIAGEHTIQRIVGGLLLTFFTLLGAIVAFATMAVTMEGIFGAASSAVMAMLPVSLESLIALEMVTSALVFGMLLLDILGVTHLTKFYSPDHLWKPLRYALTIIFTVGTLYSIYLGVMGGYIRWAATVSTTPAEAAEKVDPEEFKPALLQDKGNTIIAAEDDAEDSNSSDTAVVNEVQSKALKTLMEGIPLISYGVSVFGGVGLIPFFGAVIVGIPLIAAMLPIFLFRLISDALIIFFTAVYSFAANLMNIFIQFAETIKNWLSRNRGGNGQNIPPIAPGGGNPAQLTEQPVNRPLPETTNRNNQLQSEANGPAQIQQQNNAPETQAQPLYAQNDANWNPLS